LFIKPEPASSHLVPIPENQLSGTAAYFYWDDEDCPVLLNQLNGPGSWRFGESDATVKRVVKVWCEDKIEGLPPLTFCHTCVSVAGIPLAFGHPRSLWRVSIFSGAIISMVAVLLREACRIVD
jgi:hypothetical protein